MDDLKKMKLVYSIELIVIAIVALVIGILEITAVLTVRDVFRYIFNFATLAGVIWLTIDFIWCLKSEKKRKKTSLFDKFTLLPLMIYVLTIDIIFLINFPDRLGERNYSLLIGIALCLIGVIYIIQAIYHWYHPLPLILNEIEQDRINKITYKVLEKKEDGSVIALHIESNKKYLFSQEANIKENVDELFCLDLYPGVSPLEEIKE